jgi:hypothetical protein
MLSSSSQEEAKAKIVAHIDDLDHLAISEECQGLMQGEPEVLDHDKTESRSLARRGNAWRGRAFGSKTNTSS